jgi:poly[ADP-ribose] polymerase 16
LQLFGPEGFDAAAAATQALRQEQLEAATDVQLLLLQWLLLQLQRTWVVSHCSTESFQNDLQQAPGHSGMRAAVQQASCIFRVLPAKKLQQQSQSTKGKMVVAYHGTDFSAVHSILHQGLLTASGTRLQTTGAVFGQGIYLSTDFSTAFQFTKGRQAWQHSTLGRHLRCVLVCEVAEEATVSQPGTKASSR